MFLKFSCRIENGRVIWKKRAMELLYVQVSIIIQLLFTPWITSNGLRNWGTTVDWPVRRYQRIAISMYGCKGTVDGRIYYRQDCKFRRGKTGWEWSSYDDWSRNNDKNVSLCQRSLWAYNCPTCVRVCKTWKMGRYNVVFSIYQKYLVPCTSFPYRFHPIVQNDHLVGVPIRRSGELPKYHPTLSNRVFFYCKKTKKRICVSIPGGVFNNHYCFGHT